MIDRYLINRKREVEATFFDENVLFTFQFYLINLLFFGVDICKNSQGLVNEKKTEKLGTSTANAIDKTDKLSIDINREDVEEVNKLGIDIGRADVKEADKPSISIGKVDIEKVEKPGTGCNRLNLVI